MLENPLEVCNESVGLPHEDLVDGQGHSLGNGIRLIAQRWSDAEFGRRTSGVRLRFQQEPGHLVVLGCR